MKNKPMPAVGDLVTVITRNDNTGMIAYRPDTNTHVGKFLATPQWLESGHFCITGDKNHPQRIIKVENVVSISTGGKTFAVPAVKKPPSPELKTYEIAGSKGNSYTVINRNGAWSCGCVAGNFGKPCKHIKQAQLEAA